MCAGCRPSWMKSPRSVRNTSASRPPCASSWRASNSMQCRNFSKGLNAMMPNLSERRGNAVVLIVDDAPENLAMLHDSLDEAGFTVLVASSGEAALARARDTLPDIILLDAVMPGMDGFAVCRQLRAEIATRHIPVLFMTGLTETEHVLAA